MAYGMSKIQHSSNTRRFKFICLHDAFFYRDASLDDSLELIGVIGNIWNLRFQSAEQIFIRYECVFPHLSHAVAKLSLIQGGKSFQRNENLLRRIECAGKILAGNEIDRN